MPGPPLPERSGIRKGENGISACAPRERTQDRSGENEAWQSVVAAGRRGDWADFGCGGSSLTPMDAPTASDGGERRAVRERGRAAVPNAPLQPMFSLSQPVHTRLDLVVIGRPVRSPAVRVFIEGGQPD